MSKSVKLEPLTTNDKSWAEKAEELLMACREELSGKRELTKMIDHFLETGEIPTIQ